MATWVLPALKAVLPHVGTIISAALPVFTRKTDGAQATLHQQIAELQSAASQNTAYIKELATQLHSTAAALELAAEAADARLRKAVALAFTSLAVAGISLIGVLYLVLTR
jgi:acetyl-CoA acetyltransferase